MRPLTQPATSETLDETLRALGQAATFQEARASLVQLYGSNDLADRLLANALTDGLCAGLSQVAQSHTNQPASAQSWSDYLTGYLEDKAYAPVARAKTLADQAVTTMDLSEVSPDEARLYVAACINSE